jgi:ABC-type branched-chain amino acid transport systems, ATPase component
MSTLSIRGLRSGYGKIEVLHDVTLDVARGQIVTLIGANGAGKTTLLKTISGLLRPSAGSITFEAKASCAGHLTKLSSSASATCRRAAPSSSA